MRANRLIVITVAASAAIGLMTGSAGAQSRGARASDHTVVVYRDEEGRTRTRIVVTKRSFLDGGTEVLPGERKFSDYALPPNYSVTRQVFGLGSRYETRRQPLPDPWDMPATYQGYR